MSSRQDAPETDFKLTISEKRVQTMLDWLVAKDGEGALAIADLERQEEEAKRVLALAISTSAETSDKKREADARSSEAYRKQVEKVAKARERWQLWKNKRETALVTIDLWRTLSANQRQNPFG